MIRNQNFSELPLTQRSDITARPQERPPVRIDQETLGTLAREFPAFGRLAELLATATGLDR